MRSYDLLRLKIAARPNRTPCKKFLLHATATGQAGNQTSPSSNYQPRRSTKSTRSYKLNTLVENMARKKSAAAKTREANGDAHPKDVISMKKSVLDFDDSDNEEAEPATNGASKKRKATEEAEETEEPAFKINEEYARRFEHNKKREELHRCMHKVPDPLLRRT